MMNIYTGYYAQMKKYKAAGLIPVSIAYGTPVWYDGEVCFDLAPRRKLLVGYKNGEITQKEYTKQYNAFLNKEVKWGTVLKALKAISKKNNGDDIVLVCFEKPEDFCHRHLVSDYLNDNDIDCMEWKVK